jgi:hypothetical protein
MTVAAVATAVAAVSATIATAAAMVIATIATKIATAAVSYLHFCVWYRFVENEGDVWI